MVHRILVTSDFYGQPAIVLRARAKNHGDPPEALEFYLAEWGKLAGPFK